MKNSGLFFFAALVMILFPDHAASARKLQSRSEEFSQARHEISAGTALLPGRYAFGYNYGSFHEHGSMPGVYLDSKSFEREYTSGVWAAGYACNFTKVVSIQANLIYEAGWLRHYDRKTGAMTDRSLDSYLTAIASFKASWFNRSSVRMYSYFGLGCAWNHSRSIALQGVSPDRGYDSVVAAFQFTPIGIQVGRKMFGFAEAGIGHYFCGIAVGAGYRF